MTEDALVASHPLDDLDKKWGGNLIKQPYLLGIVYEELKRPDEIGARHELALHTPRVGRGLPD